VCVYVLSPFGAVRILQYLILLIFSFRKLDIVGTCDSSKLHILKCNFEMF